MAGYEHLPIYKEAFDLALYFEKTVRGMGRYDKYTLGTDLRNLSRDVLKLIQRANSEEDRIETLKEVRSKVEELKAVLRLERESGGPLPNPSILRLRTRLRTLLQTRTMGHLGQLDGGSPSSVLTARGKCSQTCNACCASPVVDEVPGYRVSTECMVPW